MLIRLLAAIVVVLLPTHLAAQVKFSSTPILQTGVTNAGGKITYATTDSAEVTALRIDIGPGGETGRHMHMYPAFVYVLEGAVEVEIEGSMGHSYKAGDSPNWGRPETSNMKKRSRRRRTIRLENCECCW